MEEAEFYAHSNEILEHLVPVPQGLSVSGVLALVLLLTAVFVIGGYLACRFDLVCGGHIPMCRY